MIFVIYYSTNTHTMTHTNDDTRDVAIQIVDELVEAGFIKDCIDTDDETEFSVQDIIHEKINTFLNVKPE